jgi:hypothetical protein
LDVSAPGRVENLGKWGVRGGVRPHAHPFCHLFPAWAEQLHLELL